MSAKIRLFLTLEKLKNAMNDVNMQLPYWELFFPLLGDASTATVEFTSLYDLINDVAAAADGNVVAQGGAIYANYTNDGSAPSTVQTTGAGGVLPPRRVVAATTGVVLDVKKFSTFADKMMQHFVSAGAGAQVFKVRDIIMLYLYTAHNQRFRVLYNFLESALFRGERECVPTMSSADSSLLLDSVRELTNMTNIRLDYEALMNASMSVHRAVQNELTRYPSIRVRPFFSTLNVYDKVTEPCKAFVDKFGTLLSQKIQYYVPAAEVSLCNSPMVIENILSSVEKSSDVVRMVYNAMNNIFINTVEQCAVENIRFDMEDFNKRFQLMERVRDMSSGNVVEKEAVGDVVTRKRLRPPVTSELKKFKSNKLANNNL